MFGIGYAFTDYHGINKPTFVGLDNFRKMFAAPGFWTAFWNTLKLSIVKLILNTGAAVLISLLLNEIKNTAFKKTTQTIIYLPHFMSWVVTASVFTLILPVRRRTCKLFAGSFGNIEKGIRNLFYGE
jgi:putative aldouronate transport system permease protein